MTLRSPIARRALLGATVAMIALGSAAYQLMPASASKSSVAWSPGTPEKLSLLRTTLPSTTTTTTAPVAPPETDPPAAPAPAPKPKATAAPNPITPLSSEASQMVSLINRFRAANGVGPLSVAGDATAKAQGHSNAMASSESMYHSSSLSSGISGGWTELGENVGVGGSISQLEAMFEASSPHRANLLNPNFTQIGVGVTRGADGQLYVTQTFVAR